MLAAALVVPAVASASAAADPISISVSPATVAVGGSLTVHVTPGAPTDGYIFHEARLFVMRPGLPCPGGNAYPANGDTVASGSAGPFRQGDPPEDVGLTIDDDAPIGFTTLCTQVWLVAGGLAGDALPGPSANVHIVTDARGGREPSAGDPPSGRAAQRCSLGPRRLAHGNARIRIHCRTLRRARLRLRLRCHPRHGTAVSIRRTVRLRSGRRTMRLRHLRAGRCRATLRHGPKPVARATLVVR